MDELKNYLEEKFHGGVKTITLPPKNIDSWKRWGKNLNSEWLMAWYNTKGHKKGWMVDELEATMNNTDKDKEKCDCEEAIETDEKDSYSELSSEYMGEQLKIKAAKLKKKEAILKKEQELFKAEVEKLKIEKAKIVEDREKIDKEKSEILAIIKHLENKELDKPENKGALALLG